MARPRKPPIEEAKAIPDQEAEEIALLRDKLVAAVRAVCPGWLRDQQQDIVQVAVLAVLRQREKNPERREYPASYLRKVAFTAMVDEIRRRRSRGEVPLDIAADERALVEERASPERRTMSGEISAGVRACLERLAAPRRAAVTLRLLTYKVPRIAQRMGWPRKRAENLVYRGMRDLRECLVKKGLKP